MNEELTNEVLEEMKKCGLDCALCDANGVCDKYDWQDTIQTLATALLEERAKPKNDVWKNAPEWATSAEVFWESQAQGKRRTGPVFTRELPKSRARQIAEDTIKNADIGGVLEKVELLTKAIESAINKYAEELEGKE